MRILVCGGRDYSSWQSLADALDDLVRTGSSMVDVLIQGECPYGGADAMAKRWAQMRGVAVIGFYGRTAQGKFLGPERNQRMLDDGRPDLVVAFPGGRGTADMIRRAEAAGVEVRRCGAWPTDRAY